MYSAWMQNYSCVKNVIFPSVKIYSNCEGKIWESRTLDESEYFLMCRERHIKVNGAAEVEEIGHWSGRESLPWAMLYDVWLTGNTQSSPEPLTSPFLHLHVPLLPLSLLFSISLRGWKLEEGPHPGWNVLRQRPALRGVTGKQRPFR